MKSKFSSISYFISTIEEPTVMQVGMHTFLVSPIYHSHANSHPSIPAVLNRGIDFRRSVNLDGSNFISTDL
jgi:hypothetical protein